MTSIGVTLAVISRRWSDDILREVQKTHSSQLHQRDRRKRVGVCGLWVRIHTRHKSDVSWRQVQEATQGGRRWKLSWYVLVATSQKTWGWKKRKQTLSGVMSNALVATPTPLTPDCSFIWQRWTMQAYCFKCKTVREHKVFKETEKAYWTFILCLCGHGRISYLYHYIKIAEVKSAKR